MYSTIDCQNLSIDLVYHIVTYISVEVLIYVFPEKSHHIDYTRYNYSWALSFRDPCTRIRLLLWLIKQEYIPLDAHVLDRLSQFGNLYLIEKITHLLIRLNLNIDDFYTHRAVDWACASGYLHVLEWWWRNTKADSFKYSVEALDTASIKGFLNILDWWKQRYIEGIGLKYTRDAMDRAQHPLVLNWWLEMYHRYDLNIKYSTKSIDFTNDVRILDWWLNSYTTYGTRMKYKKNSINRASASGNLEILNWWLETSIQHPFIMLKYDESAIDLASQNGHLHVLEWWWKNRKYFKFIYTNFSIDSASQNGHLDVLKWWFRLHRKGHCSLKRTVHAVNLASRNGHLHILDWWLELYIKYNISLLYDLSALEWALDKTESLHWWMRTSAQHQFIFQKINWTQYYSRIE